METGRNLNYRVGEITGIKESTISYNFRSHPFIIPDVPTKLSLTDEQDFDDWIESKYQDVNKMIIDIILVICDIIFYN